MASNRIRALTLGAIMAIAPLSMGPTTLLSVANAAAPTQAQIAAQVTQAITNATKSSEFVAAQNEGAAAQAALNALPATAPATEKKAAQDKVDAAKAKQSGILQAATTAVMQDAISKGATAAAVSAALNSAVAAGAVPAAVATAVVTQVNNIITAATTQGGDAPSLVNPPTANPPGAGGLTAAAPTAPAAFDPCAGVIATYCG